LTAVGFAGTSPWAAEALARLLDAPDIDVRAVLTQPARPAGRRRQLRDPAVAEQGAALGLPVLQPAQPADALPALREAGVEAMAVVAYGRLVPRAMLDALPWLNLHPSALPHWRGAAPIERALMAGDGELGVAVILLVEALDAGPVAWAERFPAGPEDTAGDVYARSLELGLPPLARALADAAGGRLATVPQVGEATYAPKLEPADRLLDPAAPARELHDRVRALSPHIGARLPLAGEQLTVWRSRVAEGEGTPGELAVEGGRLLLVCGSGRLELVEVQPAGGRPMESAAWLRGRRGPLPAVAVP
jgi:methionyl-tRNA formyltransferase